jgi:hypothetical protein
MLRRIVMYQAETAAVSIIWHFVRGRPTGGAMDREPVQGYCCVHILIDAVTLDAILSFYHHPYLTLSQGTMLFCCEIVHNHVTLRTSWAAQAYRTCLSIYIETPSKSNIVSMK